MRKLHVVGLALVAMLALFAITASSAFAASEWLLNGEAIVTPTTAVTTGELLLEDMNALIKVDILCSGTFDGTVGPGTADTITKVLNSAGAEETATNLAGKVEPSIDCTVSNAGSCTSPKAGELINVFPINLPWVTALSLNGTQWVDTIESGKENAEKKLTEPGYEITCTTSLLGTVTDVCTGKPSAIVSNEAGGVSGTFEEGETINKPGNCSIGGTGQALVVSPVAGLLATLTGTLSVS